MPSLVSAVFREIKIHSDKKIPPLAPQRCFTRTVPMKIQVLDMACWVLIKLIHSILQPATMHPGQIHITTHLLAPGQPQDYIVRWPGIRQEAETMTWALEHIACLGVALQIIAQLRVILLLGVAS